MTRIFRVRWKQLGSHYHCRVFSANARTNRRRDRGDDHTFGFLGELVMDEADWPAFRTSLSRSWELVEDES